MHFNPQILMHFACNSCYETYAQAGLTVEPNAGKVHWFNRFNWLANGTEGLVGPGSTRRYYTEKI